MCFTIRFHNLPVPRCPKSPFHYHTFRYRTFLSYFVITTTIIIVIGNTDKWDLMQNSHETRCPLTESTIVKLNSKQFCVLPL